MGSRVGRLVGVYQMMSNVEDNQVLNRIEFEEVTRSQRSFFF